MNATSPTTRPTHSAFKFRECLFNTNTSGLYFFTRRDPTNPFVTSKRSNIFPHNSCCLVIHNNFSQILRHFMHHTINNFVHAIFFHFSNYSTSLWLYRKTRTRFRSQIDMLRILILCGHKLLNKIFCKTQILCKYLPTPARLFLHSKIMPVPSQTARK